MSNTLLEGIDLHDKTILLGVTGGIAAYKSCELVRLLQKRGAHVKVVMSQHATEFVGPTTFRALTREPVSVGLFDDPNDPIHHISLAQEPDLIVVAPATANVIAKMAHGVADDLISTTLLATSKPILVAPAMNDGMWKASATQENVALLRSRGVHVVGPGTGYLACGTSDEGRMSEPSEIVFAAARVLETRNDLAGKRILITAGPTHEPIDPVRYIGNRSTGRMGMALATAALMRDAAVTMILGPSDLDVPPGCDVVRVQTAQEMFEAASDAFTACDAAICAAAVADYAPRTTADHKLKKANEPLDSLKLVETRDILASLSSSKQGRVVVGFAAETDDVVSYAQAKLTRKGCDLIVANDVSRSDSGFGSLTDKAWIVSRSGVAELPLLSKEALADRILDDVSKTFSK